MVVVGKRVLFFACVFLLVAVHLCAGKKEDKGDKKDDKKKNACVEQQAGTDKLEWNQCKSYKYDKCIQMTCNGKDFRGCSKTKKVCEIMDLNDESTADFVNKYGNGKIKGGKMCKCKVCDPEKDGDYCNGPPPPTPAAAAPLASRPKIVAAIGAMMLLGVVLKRALL